MIDAQRLAEYHAARQPENKAFRAACYAPHVSLYFGMMGDVLACCQNRKYPLGNVTRDSVDEIWHGPRAKALRSMLERDNFAAGCQFCQWQISVGNFTTAYTRSFDRFSVEEHNPQWPRLMEFELSNTCNLECVMCYGFFSSMIRSNREHLPPLPKPYGDEFFRQIRPYIAHLEYARFYGGEPFLAHESYRIWDIVVEDGLNLACHVTTNATQYNARVERVLGAMPVSLCVSLDGITAGTYEAIRVNASFDTVIGNLRRFREYCRLRHTHFSIAFCLMQQNWHEFGELLLLGEELDCDVCVNVVYGPPECNLYVLSREELARILARLEQQGVGLLPQLRRNAGVWLEQLEALRRRVEKNEESAETPFDVPGSLIFQSTDLNATGRYGGYELSQAQRDLETWWPGAPLRQFECGLGDRLLSFDGDDFLGLPAESCREQRFLDVVGRCEARYGRLRRRTINRGPSHVDQILEFTSADDRLFLARVISVPTLDGFELPQGASCLAAAGYVTAANCPARPEDLDPARANPAQGPGVLWVRSDGDQLVCEAGGDLADWGLVAAEVVGRPLAELTKPFGTPLAWHCMERRYDRERYLVEFAGDGEPWQVSATGIRDWDAEGRPRGWYHTLVRCRTGDELAAARADLTSWGVDAPVDTWSYRGGSSKAEGESFLGLDAQSCRDRTWHQILKLLEERHGPFTLSVLSQRAMVRDQLLEFDQTEEGQLVARAITVSRNGTLADSGEGLVLATGRLLRPPTCDEAYLATIEAEFDQAVGPGQWMWVRCDDQMRVRRYGGKLLVPQHAALAAEGRNVHELALELGEVRTTRCLSQDLYGERYLLELSYQGEPRRLLGGRWRVPREGSGPPDWHVLMGLLDRPAHGG